MFDKLDNWVNFHSQALNVRETRQNILAANIANGDTPNYQARDIDFKAELTKAIKNQGNVNNIVLHTTSNHHIQISMPMPTNQNLLYRIPYQASADGNTVEMDQERTVFIDNSIHYQSNLTFLSEQFKNVMSVLQQG
ncbi:flagellar basal body rod protein FlgB [Gilliamella apicola]|uniref:Flagellar basal body rod protein FlgB n=1 Tax=Gilliamella apicola TaxID=1196095 RepID=A0A242NGC0_9GAMM|nr:flagellar basal body rod protein FlgB [Gilliamella apicola]OTP82832.1 flagellar basal body rod protein FlgB [Gilliamella apicola]OTP85046.1 flagellar basal body rod protein FlgB [Gilliamella apicola]OTP98710.1 flagellar basal body rod protein FlgB [Gilliamella apicola]OTQ09617.1 flagellar basal body rod protein FlgB [Gilliamella apicola]OTQ18041.1 flagellar basal body rod protein FlgB [Gilliamella apicola]